MKRHIMLSLEDTIIQKCRKSGMNNISRVVEKLLSAHLEFSTDNPGASQAIEQEMVLAEARIVYLRNKKVELEQKALDDAKKVIYAPKSQRVPRVIKWTEPSAEELARWDEEDRVELENKKKVVPVDGLGGLI